jgi:hypothetical protein
MSLDEGTSVRINNLIGDEGVDRFGITPASYAAVRLLADTRVGNFYLIPGTRGACIASSSGVSCGDPGGPGQTTLALMGATPEADRLLGVGITQAGVESFRMPARLGIISFPVANGRFHVDARIIFDPATGPTIIGK